MTEGSWPPRVHPTSDPGERPRSIVEDAPDPARSERAPEAAPAGTPESIGAVSSEETSVRSYEDDLDEEMPGRRGLVVGLLIGGLVVMTALAATFLALWLGNSDVAVSEVGDYLSAERPEIEDRARAAADILINYDASNIEQKREEMLAISTGSFRDDYEQVTAALGGALENAAASSRGSILEEPRITFSSPGEADAVMRTEQIAQTRENPSGRTIEYIMRLSLIDTEEGWKVDNIEILSSEAA